MNQQINWQNPYADGEGIWLKGNLHTHTHPASGCGRVEVSRVLELYAEAGHDFLAISDHLTLTESADPRFVFIPGIEWDSPTGEHAGVYSLDRTKIQMALDIHSQEDLLAKLSGDDTLLVLNHPNWLLRPHYRREELEQKNGHDGIEIYNGAIERLDGYAIATDKWDYLLAKDRRCLGFASDDSHIEEDIGLGWLMVRAKERTPGAILRALKSGSFYCSSGVTICEIGREGDIIHIKAENAQEIQVSGSGGPRIQLVRGSQMTFNFAETKSPYVRFTLFGEGSTMAWTQPFFR